MELSEDLVRVQGILSTLHRNIGDFSTIKHRGGNEDKINKISDAIKSYLSSKHYYEDKQKYEINLRQITLFLVLNTELKHKNVFENDSNFAHLLNVTPQLTKCLLVNLVWNLDLCLFYSEAICGLPVEISLELLEKCSGCLSRAEPYVVLEQVAMFALAIYVKIYQLRNENIAEEKVNGYIIKLLERFTEVLQHYITPKTDLMSEWPPSEIFQYMGIAILKILNLLKSCFNLFLDKTVASVNELFAVATSGENGSSDSTEKSSEGLKKCNICLMSVCEANLAAVTVDVFCAWTEFQQNNMQMQQAIGNLSYEILQLIENFDGQGNLPQMLGAIAIKPKSVADKIREADEEKLIENVTINNADQILWYKALVKHGVLKSDRLFEVFKSVVHLSDEEDYLFLLNYSIEHIKTRPDIGKFFVTNIKSLSEENLIKTITQFFNKNQLINVYEIETFDLKLIEFMNKLPNYNEISIPRREMAGFLLQNPNKTLQMVFTHGVNYKLHVPMMMALFKYFTPFCNLILDGKESTVLHEFVLNFLDNNSVKEKSEENLIHVIDNLMKLQLLKPVILEDFVKMILSKVQEQKYYRADLLTRLSMQIAKDSIKECNISLVFSTVIKASELARWSFFHFTYEKKHLSSELSKFLIDIRQHIEKMEDKIDLTPIKQEIKNPIEIYYLTSGEPLQFLNITTKYNKKSEHKEQLCEILKILPCCNELEWNYVIKCLLAENSETEAITLLVDMFLVLSAISEKSCSPHHMCLSYCYKEFIYHCKTAICPKFENNPDAKQFFIRKMCQLVKYLPVPLHHTDKYPITRLFDLKQLHLLLEKDKDFRLQLLTMSNLEFSKKLCDAVL